MPVPTLPNSVYEKMKQTYAGNETDTCTPCHSQQAASDFRAKARELNIALIGAIFTQDPAWGDRLSRDLDIDRITRKDAYGSVLEVKTPLRTKLKHYLDAEEDVPDSLFAEIMASSVKRAISSNLNFTFNNIGYLLTPTCREGESAPGFILDCSIDTIGQAAELDSALDATGCPLDIVIADERDKESPVASYYRAQGKLLQVFPGSTTNDILAQMVKMAQ